MEFLVIAVAAACIGVLGLGAVDVSWKRGRYAAWKQAAKRWSGRALYREDEVTFECEVDEVRIFATMKLEKTKSGTAATFEAAAHYIVPSSGPRYFLFRENLAAMMGKVVGNVSDAKIAYGSKFDRMFVVECDDTTATRRALPEKLQRALVGASGLESVTSSAMRVVARITATATADQIDSVIRVVGLLASVDLVGHVHLRSFPGTRYQPPSGPWHRREGPRATLESRDDVVIGFRERNGRACSAAWTARSIRAIAIRIEKGRLEFSEGGIELPSEMVKRVGSCTLTGSEDDGLVLLWDEPQSSQARLLAGAQLVAWASENRTGPYR